MIPLVITFVLVMTFYSLGRCHGDRVFTLSVCVQDYAKARGWILKEFGVRMGNGPRENPWKFGADGDPFCERCILPHFRQFLNK